MVDRREQSNGISCMLMSLIKRLEANICFLFSHLQYLDNITSRDLMIFLWTTTTMMTDGQTNHLPLEYVLGVTKLVGMHFVFL